MTYFQWVGVVDGHVPVDGAAGNDRHARQHEGGGADVVPFVIHAPHLADADPQVQELGMGALRAGRRPAPVDPFHVAESVPYLPHLLLAHGGKVALHEVQIVVVEDVDVALVALEVVALAVELGGRHLIVRHRQPVVGRKERRLARAHVREDDPALFAARVGGLTDGVAVLPAVGFSRLVQASPFDVVEPAVIDAAEAAVLQAAIAQVRATVGAVDAQQPRPALVVPEHDKILAQEPGGQRRTAGRKLLGERRRLPVAAHQLAARGAAVGPGQ